MVISAHFDDDFYRVDCRAVGLTELAHQLGDEPRPWL